MFSTSAPSLLSWPSTTATTAISAPQRAPLSLLDLPPEILDIICFYYFATKPDGEPLTEIELKYPHDFEHIKALPPRPCSQWVRELKESPGSHRLPVDDYGVLRVNRRLAKIATYVLFSSFPLRVDNGEELCGHFAPKFGRTQFDMCGIWICDCRRA